MSNRKMTITLSDVSDATDISSLSVAQQVSFINVVDGVEEIPAAISSAPKPIKYGTLALDTVGLLDYYPYDTADPDSAINIHYAPSQGMAAIHNSDELLVSIYREELAYNDYNEIVAVSPLEMVALNQGSFHLQDYSVTNNRWYRYHIYPANQNAPLTEVIKDVQVKWSGWSITELHPVNGSTTQFSVSPSDVWVFNLNVETGEQAQHLARQEQQTLGQFLRYSQGLTNYITGNVSCLLGRDVLPANWILRGNSWTNEGGYQEKLPFSQRISSNDKIDMLVAWRKLVYSSNPKLLKDRKGQSFLITINDSSNKPNDSIAIQPDTISFSWTQIQDMGGVQILGTQSGGTQNGS